MFSRILIMLILAGAIFVVGLITYNQPEWILSFILLDHHIGINVALLIAITLIVLIVLGILVRLLRLPVKWIELANQRRSIRQFNYFMDGLSLYAQGNWRQACKQFARVGREPKYQFHANLFAAYAYLKQNQPEVAQTALRAARQAEHKDHFSLSLAEAKTLIAKEQRDQAIVILKQLREEQPHNQHVAELLEACDTQPQDSRGN